MKMTNFGGNLNDVLCRNFGLQVIKCKPGCKAAQRYHFFYQKIVGKYLNLNTKRGSLNQIYEMLKTA